MADQIQHLTLPSGQDRIGKRLLGLPIGATGDEDDDWFFTYYQPYRYVINRIPVYPSIGNHDADETEERDDRAQVEDNFYLRERIGSEEAAGRALENEGGWVRLGSASDAFTSAETPHVSRSASTWTSAVASKRS